MVSSIDPKEESWNQLQRQFVFFFFFFKGEFIVFEFTI